MSDQQKFNYTPQNDPSVEGGQKNKNSWMWSMIVLIVILIITLLIGGFVGVLNGRSTAEKYNSAAVEFLTNLSKDIKKSSTANDIVISLKSLNQPELPRAFLGNLSNTYRQTQLNARLVSDTVDSIAKENQKYVNLANLVTGANSEQLLINESIAILVKTDGEVGRKSQLIELDQRCFKLSAIILNYNSMPEKVQKKSSSYTESATTFCATLKNLNDAHSRRDEDRTKASLSIISTDNQALNTQLDQLTLVAKDNVSNKKSFIDKLNKTAKHISAQQISNL